MNFHTAEFTDEDYLLEAAQRYGNLARVAIEFAIATGSQLEAEYAYLNTRCAGRLALAVDRVWHIEKLEV